LKEESKKKERGKGRGELLLSSCFSAQADDYVTPLRVWDRFMSF